jgi:hypothetical protein
MNNLVWVRILKDLTPERFKFKKGSIVQMDLGRTIPGYYTPVNPDPACRYVVYQDGKDVKELTNAEIIVYVHGRRK